MTDSQEDRAQGRSERLAYITGSVNERGFVSVNELAEYLDVSRMTVHRDLETLERNRVLRKVRGGASVRRSTQFESNVQFRAQTGVAVKQQIAKAASVLFSEGDVVILDDSSTVMEMIPYIVQKSPITIITNFLQILQRFSAEPEIKVIAVGGEYSAEFQTYLGVLCETSFSELYADVVFTSSSAMKGIELYHQDQRVVSAKRAMLRSAERRVLLLDHSKIGQGALHHLCSVTDFTHMVVDHEFDDGLRERIESTGVEVIVAPSTKN